MASPAPLAFVLLVGLLPGVWLAGSVIATSLVQERLVARVLTPPLGLALWLTAIHGAALATRSFWIGLPVGTLLVATGGVLSWRLRASTPPPAESVRVATRHRRATRPRASERARNAPRRTAKPWTSTERWMWISALVTTAYLAPMALDWSLHDELPVTGHLSIASEIENGIYPPRTLSFPELELRYHYGFDVLVAGVASIARLRVDHAIDLVTLSLWASAWCLVWVTGERLVGRNWGAATAFVVLFGGGIPFFSSAPSFSSTHTLVLRLLSLGMAGTYDLNPPVVSYFFQHPWTVGIPLAFATILVVSVRDAPGPWRWGAIGLLLVTLSFCQVVLFACLVGALLVVEPLIEAKTSYRRAASSIAVIAVAVAVASRLHGFFVPVPAGSDQMIGFHPLVIGGSPWGWTSWHLQSFGLLLPLGLAGLFLLVRERLLMALLVIGSLVVLNSFRFRWSWDIVKFATVASLILAVGASAALRKVFALRPRLLWSAAGALAVVGLLASGVLFAFVVGFSGQRVPFEKEPVALSPADELAVGWLRRNIRPGEVVFRRGPAARGYAQWGGLPPLVQDAFAVHLGLPRRLFEERDRLLATPIREPDDLLRGRVRWVILDRGDDALVRLLDRWTGEHRAIVRADFGVLAVVEILGEMPPL